MSFLDLIFPAHCLTCRKTTGQAEYLCLECAQQIPLHQTLFCARCAARLPENKAVCHRDEPYLMGAAADYGYASVKTLIHALKFRSVRGAARPLADLLIRYVNGLNFPLSGYTVVPVPLGVRRERTRGFNQALCLAEPFAQNFRLPLAANVLKRVRETKPQSELKNIAERRSNMVGSFAFASPADLPKKIILLDDVTTSGVTLHAAAEVLKQNGARKIVALTVARA